MAKKRRSKRFVIIIEILSTLLLLASFASIILCGLLKDHGYGDFWWPAAGLIGFLSCDILALLFLSWIWQDAIFYEVNQKSEKYDAFNLLKLENMTVKNIDNKFLKHKFKETKNNYFRKKVFSLLKDSICYYAKNVTAADFKSTIEYELNLMDKLNERSKNICFLLFVYKNNINESDLEELRKISKLFILNEMVVPVSSCYTSIIVLINSETYEGRFLDMNSKQSISVYAHGSRLIKKYFAR